MSITSIVFKKELKDIFRDKKTLIVGILLPLLIYPVLFGVMGKGIKGQVDEVEKNMKVSIVDKGNSNLGKFIKSQKNIEVITDDKAEEKVKDGKLLLVIEIPEDVDKKIAEEKQADVKITYDNSSTKSNTAIGIINNYIEQYSKTIVTSRLDQRKIDAKILTPINLVKKTTEKESEGMGKFILSIMLPMMLIMFAATGPITAATDLGAGEKERGTLEPLLTTQASRMSLLWGKFLAITFMGIITSFAFMGGILISMKTSPEMFGGQGGVSISIGSLIIMVILTIALTMVFAALALAISIYARSFKEAQTYLTPLTFLGMFGFATYAIDAKNVSMLFLNIPILNITAILKELTLGVYNFTHIGIVSAWTIVYIVASILFARYMFSRESVIFRT